MGRSSRRLSGLEPLDVDPAYLCGSRALRRIQAQNAEAQHHRPVKRKGDGSENCTPPEAKKRNRSSKLDDIPAKGAKDTPTSSQAVKAPEQAMRRSENEGNAVVLDSPEAEMISEPVIQIDPEDTNSDSKGATKSSQAKKAPRRVSRRSRSGVNTDVKEAAAAQVVSEPVEAIKRNSKNARNSSKAAALQPKHQVVELDPSGLTRGSLLGKGRFAEVFVASSKSGQKFAMKVMAAGGKQQLERFENECKLHRLAAEHGIAPPILASFVRPVGGKKKGHLVMQLVDGPTFKELANQPEKYKSRAIEALEKIQKLHKIVPGGLQSFDQMADDLFTTQGASNSEREVHSGVLHGDLNKLDNILWDDELAEPFLIDFGLASEFTARVKADMAKHTRRLRLEDVQKKISFWRKYDLGHLKAKFGL